MDSLKVTISIAFSEVRPVDLDEVGPVRPMECDGDSRRNRERGFIITSSFYIQTELRHRLMRIEHDVLYNNNVKNLSLYFF